MATDGNDELYREVRAAIGPELVRAVPVAPPTPAPVEPKPRNLVYRILIFLLVTGGAWMVLAFPILIALSLVRPVIVGTFLELPVGIAGMLAWFLLPPIYGARKATSPDRGSIFPRWFRLLTAVEDPADDPGRPMNPFERACAVIGRVLSFFQRLR